MIRRPGAGRGPGLLIFVVWFLGCLRLAVIGRVSPRRATTFLVATRKVDKETPPAAAPARAGSLASAHGRRVASKLALAGSDIDATSPAGRGLRSALQKGKATAGSASPLPAPCRANVCIVTECPAPSSRVRHSETTCHSGHGRYPRRRCPAGGLRLRSAQSRASRAQGAMAAGLSSASSGTVQ